MPVLRTSIVLTKQVNPEPTPRCKNLALHWRVQFLNGSWEVELFGMAGKHLSLLVHFIWSTSRREPWIGFDWQDDLFGVIGGIMKKKNAKLICAGGMFDHIHLYGSLPSTTSIADFVNAVKSNSSRWVHETFPNRKGFAWQEGYGAFSVSKSEERKVIRYVRNQRQHHAKQSFKDEFVEFLVQNQIEYDEKYLWD